MLFTDEPIKVPTACAVFFKMEFFWIWTMRIEISTYSSPNAEDHLINMLSKILFRTNSHNKDQAHNIGERNWLN